MESETAKMQATQIYFHDTPTARKCTYEMHALEYY
jgi:hypothetical protein